MNQSFLIAAAKRLPNILGGATAFMATTLSAQSLPPSAQSALPTREEVNRVPLREAAPLPPRVSISGGLERDACALDAPRFAKLSVDLKAVVFDGLGQVDQAPLQAAIAPYLGTSLPIANICQIRDAAATALRAQGYLGAVQIPPQEVADGNVHFTVLLARMVAVQVRGDAGNAERLVAGYLERLTGNQPFDQRKVERVLLLAGDLPGLDIQLVLRSAGTVPGEVIGDVTVRRTPVLVGLSVQNYGSRAVGRFAGLANVQFNDLLGIGDRLSLGAYDTAEPREQFVLQAAYDIRPGTSGLSIGGRVTVARGRPEVGGGDPLRSRALILGIEAGYPLVRTQALSIRLAGGFEAIDQSLRFSGLPFTRDRLRMGYMRAELLTVDPGSIASLSGLAPYEPRWRMSGSIELRQGVSGLGASRRCGPAPTFAGCTAPPAISRFDADPQPTLIRANAVLDLSLGKGIGLRFSPRAQYSFDPLLSYEQYSVGNFTVGRGYDPGAVIGDSGIGAQTELSLARFAVNANRQISVQPYGFFDAAKVWTRGTLTPGGSQKAYSVGAGLRATIGSFAQLDILAAVPLRRTNFATRRDPARLLFTLTSSFEP